MCNKCMFSPTAPALMSAKAELGVGNVIWGCVSSRLPSAPRALGPVVTLDTGPVLVVLSAGAELFGCGCRAAFEVTQLVFASCSQQKGSHRVCAGRG